MNIAPVSTGTATADSSRMSVVICAHTLDRWNELSGAVASVIAQDRAPHEIIVVIDNNEALRQRATRTFVNATVLANTGEPGLSGARMTGVDHATGDLIAFLDDDAVAEAGWLTALIESYRDPAVLGVGGPVEPLWRTRRPYWFPTQFDWVIGCTYDGMDIRNGRIRNPIGANMSVRTDVLRRTGGFSSHLGRRKLGFSVSGKARTGGKAESCEETEFCIRACRLYPGGYFAFHPRARVLHIVPAQRATWKYFVNRCLVEGMAKATVAGLAGAKGLNAEGRYVRQVLPRAVAEDLMAALSGEGRAAARAGAITVGFLLTAFAYARTRLMGFQLFPGRPETGSQTL
ncbi:glycosyltransferase [Aurantimonas aggregata]|uniref:Glycosyltransferase n=1 Tax=Aurantimonas aggregata TaxID=2047720 RepID=A0A6L9MG64_9HYPH|nr:glycosyltransferase family 2 protein [Aurantimonas aggregata]NDV86795.1 glycosyltransferase [Aurantimonas aggregata]